MGEAYDHQLSPPNSGRPRNQKYERLKIAFCLLLLGFSIYANFRTVEFGSRVEKSRDAYFSSPYLAPTKQSRANTSPAPLIKFKLQKD